MIVNAICSLNHPHTYCARVDEGLQRYTIFKNFSFHYDRALHLHIPTQVQEDGALPTIRKPLPLASTRHISWRRVYLSERLTHSSIARIRRFCAIFRSFVTTFEAEVPSKRHHNNIDTDTETTTNGYHCQD